MCGKLTEQFKKHLINHENMKKDVYKRFEIIEGHLPVYRSELYKLLENNEQRLLGKIKDIKDAVEATMLTNFQVLDERVDKFSELVDANLETLRKAIADNRDVYVSVINKTNLEQEERMNGFVEDLENIVNELYEVQSRLDGGAGGPPQRNYQASSININGADAGDIAKQLHDLEAHLNTSIITEKSVRKAQDKYLAEEIDKLCKQMAHIAEKLKIVVDEDGQVIDKNRSRNEQDLVSTKMTVDELVSQTRDLKVQLNDIKELIGKGDLESAQQKQDREKVSEAVQKELDKLRRKIEEKEENEYQQTASLDQVDGKI